MFASNEYFKKGSNPLQSQEFSRKSEASSLDDGGVEFRSLSTQEKELITRSRMGSVSMTPKQVPIVAVDWKLKLSVYILMLTGVVIAFGVSYNYFKNVQQIVLVDESQRGQCSDEQQIYSLAPGNQVAQIYFRVWDESADHTVDYPKFLNFYANWSSCPQSEIGDTFEFNRSTVGTYSGISWENTPNFNTDLSMTFSASPTGQTSATFYQNNATTGGTAIFGQSHYATKPAANACFELTCGIGYPGNETAPDFYTLLTSNCATTQSFVYDDNYADTAGDIIEITGGIAVTKDSVNARCTASICGQVIPYFQTSNNIQPSGIYQCTIDTSIQTALAASFSNSLMAYNILFQVVILSVLIYLLGLGGFFKFVQTGGALRID